MLGVPPAHKHADRERGHAQDAPKADAKRPFLRRILAEQQGLADGKNDASRKTEKNPYGYEGIDVFSRSADEREESVKDERGRINAIIAEARDKPTRDGKAER